MMRNKSLNQQGQVLILFIMILPIILLGVFVFLSYCTVRYEEKNLKHIGELSCRYLLEEKEENKVRELIQENDSNIKEIEIKWGTKLVQIKLTKEIPILFLNKKMTVQKSVECEL